MSEISEICMVGLMVGWAFIFCNFCRVPRRGPHGQFLSAISDFVGKLAFSYGINFYNLY